MKERLDRAVGSAGPRSDHLHHTTLPCITCCQVVEFTCRESSAELRLWVLFPASILPVWGISLHVKENFSLYFPYQDPLCESPLSHLLRHNIKRLTF